MVKNQQVSRPMRDRKDANPLIGVALRGEMSEPTARKYAPRVKGVAHSARTVRALLEDLA